MLQNKPQPDTNSTYTEIVFKRLRTLKKRVAKIEKYEHGDRSALNSDQLSAIEKKPEVLLIIKELEELQAQISQQEQEDKKAEKKRAKAAAQEQQQKISQAVYDGVLQEAEKLKNFAKLIVAVCAVLPRIPATIVSKVNKQLLLDLHHELLLNGSANDFSMDLTPEQLQALVDGKVALINQMFCDEALKSQLESLFDFVKDMAEVEAHVTVMNQQPTQSQLVDKIGTLSFTTESAVQVEEYQDPAILVVGSSSSSFETLEKETPQMLPKNKRRGGGYRGKARGGGSVSRGARVQQQQQQFQQ